MRGWGAVLVLSAFLLACSALPQGERDKPVVTPKPVSEPTAPQGIRWQAVPWPVAAGQLETAGLQQAWQLNCQGGSKLHEALRAACQQWPVLPLSVLQDPARFTLYQVSSIEGQAEGMLTGYYEPLLQGSSSQTTRFRYPVYGTPKDLLTVDLGALYPTLKGNRIRGRLEGKRVVPYLSRAEIDAGKLPADTPILAWVDDPVDLFFLHVQGSGRIQLAQGGQLRLGYAEQNGHPYVSIGRELVQRGEMTAASASMQGIKQWAQRNPERVAALLGSNPSYVFFKPMPSSNDGPLGSLGVPLTAGYSIAVDPQSIPLGTPVLLSTRLPGLEQPVWRLVLAQDTGGAIRGTVRADLFTGFGEAAGELAGKMRQPLQYWVVWPVGAAIPAGVTAIP